MMRRHPRLIDEGSIYILVASPIAWAAHFLLCYWVAAVWCAKAADGDGFMTVQVTIWILTAVALASVLWVALHAWRRYDADFVIHEELTRDTEHERKRFTGHVALLLSAISAVAIVFTAIPSILIDTC